MPEQVPDTDCGNDGIRGRNAVVTGSSSGIGRAIAVALAQAGCNVCLHGFSNRAGAEETQTQVKTHGVDASIEMADISDPAACERLVNRAWAWRGGVDIWVNNAGADVLTTDLAQASFADKLARLWAVDVLGTIRLSRAVGARMKEAAASGAVIINMGWDQAEVGMGGDSGEMFATSKGAVMAFTRSLARTLAPEVRVNCLAPGWIKTSWAEDASDYWQQRATSESLLARWGTPEDVANVTRFLVSPDAAFVTGQIVAVNGGLNTSADISTSPQS